MAVVIVAGYLYKDTDGGSEADEIGVDTVRASLTSSLRSSLVSAPLLQVRTSNYDGDVGV